MFRFQGTVNSAQGPALDGVLIYVCTQPASTGSIPPSPLASLFTDSGGGTPLTNPVVSDGLGNFFFYAAAGTYTIVYYDPLERIPTTIFPDQAVVGPGAGTVTSITISGPIQMTVAGSPITSSGTITLDWANENANTFFAGPASGGATKPTFRALVAGDLPGGVGTVSSVGMSLTLNNALISGSVGGSPITTSGTLTLTLSFANQAANTVFAGPASGGSGAITARKLVAADIFGRTAVVFSATPVFDASTFASPVFSMTLTGNVTSSSVTNPTPGQVIRTSITQDGTGSRTFAFPANFRGADAIAPDPNFTSVQEFFYDDSTALWRAVAPGRTMPAS